MMQAGAGRAEAVPLKQNLMGIGRLRTHIEPCRSPPAAGTFLWGQRWQSGLRALHTLVEEFSVLGVHVQHWMLIAALITAIAVVSGLRK